MSQHPFIEEYKLGSVFSNGDRSLRALMSWLDGVIHYGMCNPTLDQKLHAARILMPSLVNIHKAGLRMQGIKQTPDNPGSDTKPEADPPPDYSDKIETQLLDFIENNPEQISAYQDYGAPPAEIYAWSSKMKADFTRLGQPYLPPAYRPVFPGDPFPEEPKQFYGYSPTIVPKPPQEYLPIWANKVRARYQMKKEREYHEKKKKAAQTVTAQVETIPAAPQHEHPLTNETAHYPIPVENPMLDHLFQDDSEQYDEQIEDALLNELLQDDDTPPQTGKLPFDDLFAPLRKKAELENLRLSGIQEFVEASNFIINSFFTPKAENNQASPKTENKFFTPRIENNQASPILATPSFFPGTTPDPFSAPIPVSTDQINNPNTPEPTDTPQTSVSPSSDSTMTPDPVAGLTPPTGSAPDRNINTTSSPAGTPEVSTPQTQTPAAAPPITPPLTQDSLSPP